MTDQAPEELATIPPATGVDDQATGTDSGEQAPRVQRPTVCRDVWYSEPLIGKSLRAAKVTGTRDSISELEGVPLPTTELHVHLIVFPPQGTPYPVRDAAYDANGAPGTWRWPTRIDN